MGLGLTQLLAEVITRNLPGGKEQPLQKADNFTAICEPVVQKIWEPQRLTILQASTASYRDSLTFFYKVTIFEHYYCQVYDTM
jgi:hypothetical protein